MTRLNFYNVFCHHKKKERLLAYMAIDIDFDDNKPHVLIKQRFMYCAFIINK